MPQVILFDLALTELAPLVHQAVKYFLTSFRESKLT
jgi:hypothetical protein